MIARHLQLDIDDVEVGMTLAATLLDPQGGVLLPEGVALTEAMLTSLRRRGMDQISVVNERISEADLAAEKERVRQQLALLFRRCCTGDTGGASVALRASVMQYRTGGPE